MREKIRKVFFVLQFIVVLTVPITIIADLIPYVIKEGSFIKGIETMFYDAMLNCADDHTGIVFILCLIISIIGIVGNNVLKDKQKDGRYKNESIDKRENS